jgi:hypothetical protein
VVLTCFHPRNRICLGFCGEIGKESPAFRTLIRCGRERVPFARIPCTRNSADPPTPVISYSCFSARALYISQLCFSAHSIQAQAWLCGWCSNRTSLRSDIRPSFTYDPGFGRSQLRSIKPSIFSLGPLSL